MNRWCVVGIVFAASIAAGLSGAANAQQEPQEPRGTSAHSLESDGIGFVWVFGGLHIRGSSDELWRYDLKK